MATNMHVIVTNWLTDRFSSVAESDQFFREGTEFFAVDSKLRHHDKAC